MGTNEMTESLQHNKNLFDLPFEPKTSKGTVFSHSEKILQFYVHTFCVERPELALMQLILMELGVIH